MMMSTNASGSSQKLVKMVTWRAILFVGLCWLLIMDRSSEACAPTFPGEDITEEDITESPVPISPVPTCLVGTTPLGSFSPTPGSTVVEGATVTLTCDASAQLDGTVATATCSAGVLSPTSLCVPTCLVGTTPYGSFSPAPGSTVLEGDTVTLTCDASAYLDGAVVTATCSSGVLSSTSLCLPCPDTTWIYDSTTDRCFKAFAATPVPGMCSKDVPCAGLAALYGAPSALAYTLNFQALVDAGQIGRDNSIGNGAFYVGIGDPVTAFQYQLDDGTPVPLASITPFFRPGAPSDPSNLYTSIAVYFPMSVGFDDLNCAALGSTGSVCQLQLTP